MDGWMDDEWTDGRKDGRAGGRTDGLPESRGYYNPESITWGHYPGVIPLGSLCGDYSSGADIAAAIGGRSGVAIYYMTSTGELFSTCFLSEYRNI